jgi:hypothetical protein
MCKCEDEKIKRCVDEKGLKCLDGGKVAKG